MPMSREVFLQLAAAEARAPIATDLVLHEYPDAAEILLDGVRLGQVIEQTALRHSTPLAFHLMDLMVEKAVLLEALGLAPEQIDGFHFESCPTDDMLRRLQRNLAGPLHPRLAANVAAIEYIARRPNLIPMGMCIGPFSLMSKLLADPITPVYLAGNGVAADQDEEVSTMQAVLAMAMTVVLRSIHAQIAAGATAMLIAEPAANTAYLSPRQIESGSDVFDRFVMTHNRAIAALLHEHGVDLIFHCCGELTDAMVQRFASLRPAMLSLGSSRRLWDDARLVPRDVVLYGNLPTKKFLSHALISTERVRQMSRELLERMRQTGHPFILGSECDVLSVEGCEQTIGEKVRAMLEC